MNRNPSHGAPPGGSGLGKGCPRPPGVGADGAAGHYHYWIAVPPVTDLKRHVGGALLAEALNEKCLTLGQFWHFFDFGPWQEIRAMFQIVQLACLNRGSMT